MQLENLTKEQFIRDFKDTLHQEQLIKVAKATPTEIFTALAGLIRKYYTNTWIERNHALSDNQEKIAYCRRNVSTQDKAQIYRAYGIPKNCWNRYTIDHFYPLSMGGSNHSDNLWPEHKFVKNTRMNLELETFQRLQNGEITQKEALDIIRSEKLHPGNPESRDSSQCDRLD